MVQWSSQLAANSVPSVSRFIMSNLQSSRCSKPLQAITPPIPGPSSLVQGQPTPQALPSSLQMPTTAGFTFLLPEQAHPQVHAPTVATLGSEVGQGPPLEVPLNQIILHQTMLKSQQYDQLYNMRLTTDTQEGMPVGDNNEPPPHQSTPPCPMSTNQP